MSRPPIDVVGRLVVGGRGPGAAYEEAEAKGRQSKEYREEPAERSSSRNHAAARLLEPSRPRLDTRSMRRREGPELQGR